MSPILVRPVREQFEHDRVIRVLQARYKRKYEVVSNPGAEQNASVGVGEIVMYPDLVLFSQERSRKLQATIEVETTESINTLEAMAEWRPFGRLRAQFFLFVPPNALDTARRLCAEHHVDPAEIWTYHTAVDQVRFTMVHRAPETNSTKGKPVDRVFEKSNQLPETLARTDKLDRIGKSEPAETSDKLDKAKPDTLDAPTRLDTSRKAETPVKIERPVHIAKPAKTDRISKLETSVKNDQSRKGQNRIRPAKPAPVKRAPPAAKKAPPKSAKPARKGTKPAKSSKLVKKTAAKKPAKAKRR